VTLTATDLELSIRTAWRSEGEKRGFGNDPAKNSLSWCDCCPKAKSVSSARKPLGAILADRKTYRWLGMAKELSRDSGVPHPL